LATAWNIAKCALASAWGKTECCASCAVSPKRPRARGAKIRQRRHKQIAHAADRRQPGEGRPVRAYAHAADVGIVEEDFSRDQIGLGGSGAAEIRQWQHRANRSGVAQEIATVHRDEHAPPPSERLS